MWNIWCSINKFVFVAKTIFGNIREQNELKTCREVCLQRGKHDTLIVNVDEGALTYPGLASFGGLIRHIDGSFIFWFHGSVGWSNILQAESGYQAMLGGEIQTSCQLL
ncbi:hypothetical protein MtrunA17_Chr1g0203221 [Medicago truncatula]|uniref:Uncharacterized protein n=1 Tax=Medicago truncatula TaxID=3880 RepID=A0A396K7M9_MEDTR|nr:hypothetical protein MtrunA17_Chr1g0203221 [Medicago truncatula]